MKTIGIMKLPLIGSMDNTYMWRETTGTIDNQSVKIKIDSITGTTLISGPDVILNNLQKLFNDSGGFAGLTFAEFVEKMLDVDGHQPTT